MFAGTNTLVVLGRLAEELCGEGCVLAAEYG